MAQEEINYSIKQTDDISDFRIEIEKLEPCYQRTILEFLVHEFEKFDFDKVQIKVDVIGDFDIYISINEVFVLWISVGYQTQIISIYGAEYRWDEEYSDTKLANYLFPIYKEVFEGKYRAILKKNKKGELLGTTVYFKGASDCSYSLFSFSKNYPEEVMGVNLYK